MNTPSSVRRNLILAMQVSGFLCLGLPRTQAVMQLLPISLEYPEYNGSDLSGDGNVVIGRVGDTMCRWTQALGAVPLPLPANGRRWDDADFMSDNGGVIVGDGDYHGSIYGSGWAFTQGHGLAVATAPGKTTTYRGITSAADCLIREVDDDIAGKVTYYRDYNGFSIPWVNFTNGGDGLVSGDGRILFGLASLIGSAQPVPCYWTVAGYQYFCTALSGPLQSLPMRSSKNGRIIVGSTYTGADIQGYGPATKTFRWDTGTNTVLFYSPPKFLETEPTMVSPDGDILVFGGWESPYLADVMLVDSSTPTELSKGPQEIPTWLVDQGYLNAADIKNRTDFYIFGISDNRAVVVGTFVDINGITHSFIARRIVLVFPFVFAEKTAN